MKKENKVQDFVNSAKEFADKTKQAVVNAIDQNSDGKFDAEDIQHIADNVGNKVQDLKDKADDAARERKLKDLKPLFVEQMSNVDFYLPKLIKVSEKDKKHCDSELCNDSIGHLEIVNGVNVLILYNDHVSDSRITFKSNTDSEFFYVDPCDKDEYIPLDKYYSYLKVVRVNELEKTAQSLGAKHFKVTYKEDTSVKKENKVKANAKVKKVAEAAIEHTGESLSNSSIDIVAESDFIPHDPEKPALKYFKYDPTILQLIDMRMNTEGQITHKKYTFKMSETSGIKEKDAAKIGSVLKTFKADFAAKFEQECKEETKRILEYEIDF